MHDVEAALECAEAEWQLRHPGSNLVALLVVGERVDVCVTPQALRTRANASQLGRQLVDCALPRLAIREAGGAWAITATAAESLGLGVDPALLVGGMVAPIASAGGTLGALVALPKASGSSPGARELCALEQIAGLFCATILRLRARPKPSPEGVADDREKLEQLALSAREMAHDFNNFLSAVVGNAEMARLALGAHEAAKYIDQIREAAVMGSALVQDLLSLGREAPSPSGWVELGGIVKDAVQLVRAVLPADVVVRACVMPGAPMIRGAAADLTRLVWNLLLNAGEAIMPRAGRIDLEVRAATAVDASADELPDELVVLEVTDNGRGMDRATRLRAFDRSFSTKSGAEVSGLGLSVVHRVVLRHGGRIDVLSESGHGTTVKVVLPRHGVAAPRVSGVVRARRDSSLGATQKR